MTKAATARLLALTALLITPSASQELSAGRIDLSTFNKRLVQDGGIYGTDYCVVDSHGITSGNCSLTETSKYSCEYSLTLYDPAAIRMSVVVKDLMLTKFNYFVIISDTGKILAGPVYKHSEDWNFEADHFYPRMTKSLKLALHIMQPSVNEPGA